MLFLLLTILSSVSVSAILKINESRGGCRMVVAGMNYIVAMALAFTMSSISEKSSLDIGTGWIALGLASGVGFVAGFVMLMRGLNEIGLAIPTSAARLSMLIPVTGSIIVFNEQPSALQIAGILAGILAFVLLGAAQRRRGADQENNRESNQRSDRNSDQKISQGNEGAQGSQGSKLDLGAIGLLVAIFAIVGTTDFSMKIAQSNGIDSDALAFYIFLSASLTCWLRVAFGRMQVTGRDMLLGALLGIPNYFSVYFLLLALERLDASVVFPSVSAGAVVLVTIVAIVFWKEHPNRTAWFGIALAAIAVALLGFQQGS